MIVHFLSGSVVGSTEIETWPKEDLVAFARTIQNFGSALDLRFSAISIKEGYDPESCFVYARTEKIEYLEFTESEYNTLQTALNPPKEVEGETK